MSNAVLPAGGGPPPRGGAELVYPVDPGHADFGDVRSAAWATAKTALLDRIGV
ncbi:hypothetical protein [Nocardia cyriacigeorgica]|uniref:hypothetical protein n=1 Tax=Nocardia cyriacigeorgica TaxID=135487 RepID=UPI0024584396|nr:hypothetical protein [Nocardia cyriacigeorgica]